MTHHRLTPKDVRRRSGLTPPVFAVALLLAFVLTLAPFQTVAAQALAGGRRPAVPAYQAAEPSTATPSVGGTALRSFSVPGVLAFADAAVDADVLENVRVAINLSLADVPDLTGLPAFQTPITAFVLADDERFRQALAEIAQVRVDLVSDDIGGYTIERDGTMLVFFAAPSLVTPASALLGYAHEFAHLAVREATQRRTVPQWFNEGYASWIAWRAAAQHFPEIAALQQRLDRASVASALHTRGLIPWPDLVTRARFSRAGVDGLANLAYGQSTLFIDFLAERHGTPAPGPVSHRPG